jgi:hypothetical protein
MCRPVLAAVIIADGRVAGKRIYRLLKGSGWLIDVPQQRQLKDAPAGSDLVV